MNPESVQLLELRFNKFIDHTDIAVKVNELGRKISADYQGEVPIMLGVLNGCFIFMGDLIRAIPTPKEIIFLRAKSYVGLKSTGDVMIEDFPVNIEGRHVIVVEDIIDKGHTLDAVLSNLKKLSPKSIKVASFLMKPDAYEYDHKVDYCGFEIANDFVVGYGLDYNEYGRGLKSLYKLAE